MTRLHRAGAALATLLVAYPAAQAADTPAAAGGPDYHVVVTVPVGWQVETSRRPVRRVLVMSPLVAAFDSSSAQPMKRQPDQIVCGFSRAVKKDPIAQSQEQINAGVRQNFEDLKADMRYNHAQDVLLLRLIEDQGMVGVAIVMVGMDAEHYGYLYASATFDTPFYQYKGDCIGELSEDSVLKGDIVQIIGSLRPVL